MDGCSNTCDWKPPGSSRLSPDITQAAETLAGMLTEAAELQNFVRLTRAVRMDEEANEIIQLMNECGAEYDSAGNAMPALEERLEALPVIREYRQAERAVRLVFRAVEEAISSAAGVPFAEHAQPRACG